MTERWAAVAGYEGLYEVSSLGRIRSLRSGRLMKLTESKTTGYLVLNLSKDHGPRTHRVHQVVMQAFIGPQPPGIQVDHVNGIKSDNRLSNLEYVTPQENDRRATAMGLKASGNLNGSRTKPDRHSRGERHYAARLSRNDIEEIRRKVSAGRTRASVAREYKVDRSHVSRIVSGDSRKAG